MKRGMRTPGIRLLIGLRLGLAAVDVHRVVENGGLVAPARAHIRGTVCSSPAAEVLGLRGYSGVDTCGEQVEEEKRVHRDPQARWLYSSHGGPVPLLVVCNVCRPVPYKKSTKTKGVDKKRV